MLQRSMLVPAIGLLAMLISAVPAPAQDMDTGLAWAKAYNGPGDSTDVAVAIVCDTFIVDTLGLYVVGYSFGDGTDFDYTIVKYDGEGNQLWVARYNGPGDSADVVIKPCYGVRDSIYVTGYSYGDGTDFDYATVAYDTGGTELWVARYNGPANGDDRAYAMTGDSFGNIYVTGKSWSNDTDYDYATIKYDPDGDTSWVRTYNGPGDSTDVASGIVVSASGDVYVTGTSYSDSTDFDYATIKYDTDGNEEWVARYNGPADSADSYVYGDWIDEVLTMVVTGKSCGVGTGFDYATVAYDTTGNELWVARYNGPGDSTDIPSGLSVSSSGSIFVTGKSWGDGTDFDYATVKYDPAGNEEWVARYNGPADSADGGSGISDPLPEEEGCDTCGVYVTGYSYDNSTDFDCVTIRYDSSGNEVWVARYDSAKAMPDHGWSLDIDASGNVYVAGTVSGFEEGTDEDFLIMKYVQFLRGDATGDGSIDVADVMRLINYVFIGGSPPQPPQAGDVNCDGQIDTADVIFLINYLFLGGSLPDC